MNHTHTIQWFGDPKATGSCMDPNCELVALRVRAEKAEARVERLEEAILYTTELYREPIRYETSKGKLKPNLSIGFETRYQAMYDLAMESRRPPPGAEA